MYTSLPLRAHQAVVVVDKLHRPNHSSGGDEETQDLIIGPQLYQEGGDAIVGKLIEKNLGVHI